MSVIEMVSIQKRLWEPIEPIWNLYCPKYNNNSGFVEISIEGLRNHLSLVKYELWNTLSDGAQEGYKFLLDYFSFIKGRLFDKIWIIVDEPNKIYKINNIFIIGITDEEYEDFDFILTIDKKSKNIISVQYNSLFDVYVALHKKTNSFNSDILACKFIVSVKDKVGEKVNEESFWVRNPHYSKILTMSDDAIIEKFNSKYY